MKLIGQVAFPSFDEQNKPILSPFKYQCVFVFTGKKATAARETSATGSYDFDLAVDEYTVYFYLKADAQKKRYEPRTGSIFSVTSTTKTNALDEWLSVKTTIFDDPLVKYYEQILKDMQKTSTDFKNETQTVGTGKFMKEGAYGIGKFAIVLQGADVPFGLQVDYKSGLYVNNSFNSGFQRSCYGVYLKHPSVGYESWLSWGHTIVSNINLEISTPTGGIQKVSILNSGNTTVDSNGFIKKASPIIKLFDDHIEFNEHFVDTPIFEKIDTGVYKISNTLGLAKEGWTYEKPRGGDGNPYFRIEIEKLEDGCIVSVHDEYEMLEKATIVDAEGNRRTINKIVKVLSQARDIKENERWVDLRFHEEPKDHEIEE